MAMQIGVSYYPELVDEKEWTRDLALMRKTGISVIRMLDFAWTAIEPRESCYEFGWLDRFLELSMKNGIRTILCTPTATPPAWLARQYPEIMAMDHNGSKYLWGTRRAVCTNSRVYRHYSEVLASKLAERYGKHKSVIGWQIDNELIGTEGFSPECHCSECVFLFRQWVKSRYGTVQAVNEAWGLRFWNQELSDWGDLDTPKIRGSVAGSVLEYGRFYNEGIASYIRLQRDALRTKIAATQFITHNSTGLYDRCLDHIDFIRDLDYGAWDAYMGAAGNQHPLGEAFTGLANDMFRSAKQKPFLILETNTDDSIYPAYWAEARARGCEILLFWHWRRHRFNAENRCPALCDYSGKPYPGRLEKIKSFVERIKADRQMPKTFKKQKAVLLYSQDGVRIDHRNPSRPIPYLDALVRLYQAFWQLGVPMDVVRPGEAIDGYGLAVMPCIRLIDKKQAETVKDFVRGGGILLASAKTAHMDTNGVYYPEIGGPLLDLLGIRISEAELNGVSTVVMDDGCEFTMEGQAEEVVCTTAKAIGCFDGNKSKPAVFVNKFGKGKVYYIACVSVEASGAIARDALKSAGIDYIENTCDKACTVPHLSGKGLWYFNHSDQPVTISGTSVPAKDFVLNRQGRN